MAPRRTEESVKGSSPGQGARPTEPRPRSTRGGLVALGVCIATLWAAGAVFRRYAARHFLPERVIVAAERARPDVLLVGNSLMAVGGDVSVLQALLPGTRIANAALGATEAPEHELVVRRFLRVERPRQIVYGWFATQLLPTRLQADKLYGNRLVLLTWSEARDVGFLFPGFPFHQTLDGTAFLAKKYIPLLTYLPVLQSRIEGARRGVAVPQGPRNQFGQIADFRAMEDEAWGHGEQEIAAARRGEGFALHASVARMRAEAHAAGVQIVWVTMPVTSVRARTSQRGPEYRAYAAWAARELSRDGDATIDASQVPGISDGDFSDGLHLGAEGARKFSAWLGERLVAIAQLAL